jgi:hypothetical protein
MAKYLYVARCEEHNKTKIGITDNLKRRMSHLSYEQGSKVVAVYKSEGIKNAEQCEKQALECCVNRIEGEWFNCTHEKAIECVISAVSLLGVAGDVHQSNVKRIASFEPTQNQRDWLEATKEKTKNSFAVILKGLIQKEIDNESK